MGTSRLIVLGILFEDFIRLLDGIIEFALADSFPHGLQ